MDPVISELLESARRQLETERVAEQRKQDEARAADETRFQERLAEMKAAISQATPDALRPYIVWNDARFKRALRYGVRADTMIAAPGLAPLWIVWQEGGNKPLYRVLEATYADPGDEHLAGAAWGETHNDTDLALALVVAAHQAHLYRQYQAQVAIANTELEGRIAAEKPRAA